MANLQRDLKLVEDSYGDDVLDLVVARGYLASCSRTPTWPVTSSAIRPTSRASCRT